MAKTGRPRIEIPWKQVDNMLAIQCTGKEIASVIGCSYETLERACKREHSVSFADYSSEKRGVGMVSLRRKQWTVADSGNPTMLIWLGKQWLGQSEKQSHEISGKDGGPIQTEDVSARDILSSRLAGIAARTGKTDSSGGPD